MIEALDVVFLTIAVVSLIASLYFFVRALRTRGRIPANTYGVERQNLRQRTLAGFAQGGFFLLLSLILFSVFGVSALPDQLARPTQVLTIDTVTPENIEPASTITAPVAATALLSPTSPVPSRTPRPTQTPLPTDTPVIITAIVASPNGLWLRESPGGSQQLELIPDGARLVVLEGLETVDNLDWQRVETQAGNIGWVAVEFIVYE